MTVAEGPSRLSTSFDVARLAGVSRSTVSNILNGNGARFSEATRQKVLDAANELEYRPSLAGRSLVSGRSDTVVLLLPNTTFGSNLQDAVDEMMAGTSQYGGNVIVRFAGNTPEATERAISALRPLAVVDFGVLSPEGRIAIERHGTIIVPTLAVEGDADTKAGPGLEDADGGIARLQADVLLAGGPRTLWYAALTDSRLDPYGPRRYSELRNYCLRAGLPEPGHIEVTLTLAGAITALQHVLDEPGPAAVACYNDDVAIALLAAARELGVDVPRALSVVGVDHQPSGQLWSPRLTTVDTDLRGMITDLALDLQARLRNEEPVIHSVARHFTLVPGETA